jgi:hypothetical protein
VYFEGRKRDKARKHVTDVVTICQDFGVSGVKAQGKGNNMRRIFIKASSREVFDIGMESRSEIGLYRAFP